MSMARKGEGRGAPRSAFPLHTNGIGRAAARARPAARRNDPADGRQRAPQRTLAGLSPLALAAAPPADQTRPCVLTEEERSRRRVWPTRRGVGEPRVARRD